MIRVSKIFLTGQLGLCSVTLSQKKKRKLNKIICYFKFYIITELVKKKCQFLKV